ncbi:MAG: VanZ family protein [Burkholderiales bacterium]|nr:VanZ family protein [Burkholderiales bacterium]
MTQVARTLRRGAIWALSDPDSKRWWRCILAVMVFSVGWLALSPAPPDALDSGWDKLNHAGAFAALTVAAVFAAPRSRAGRFGLIGAVLCFGVLIEIAQSFTPTRSAEWGDLAADAIGMAAGGLAAMLVTRLGAVQLR